VLQVLLCPLVFSGSVTSTVTGTEATPTTVQTSVTTTYSVAGGIGSLTTYGVIVTKTVETDVNSASATPTTVDGTATFVYSSMAFINGSSSASTTYNLTNPSSYHLVGVIGYSTADGWGTVSVYQPDASSGTAFQVNKDTYYSNGTAILSAVSLGTFDYVSSVQVWIDAKGSPWLGYITQDTSAAFTGLTLLTGSAGEIAYNPLSANALSSIFATLALMIAALFAF